MLAHNNIHNSAAYSIIIWQLVVSAVLFLFFCYVSFCFQLLTFELSNTYIHNWPLQPFCQDYGLASHTTYVGCVNCIQLYCGGINSLTSTPNDKFLTNFFMASLFTIRVFARNLLRENRRRNIYFFHISIWCPRTRALHLISQHTTW